MAFISNINDTEERVSYHIGFNRGLNVAQDPSLVSDDSLTVAENVTLVINGVQRRKGSLRVYGEGSAGYVWGSGGFYDRVAGNRYFVRVSNQRLQKLNTGTKLWEDVGSTAFADAPTFFVQARNDLYIYNGVNPLRRYDGTTLTTYTQILTPTGLAVSPQGTTGSQPYSYRIEAINDIGRTAACASVAIANGNAVLDTTNFNRLTWDVTTGATAYNVFGRRTTGIGEVYLSTVYTNSYDDSAQDETLTGLFPSEFNTTGGIKATKAVFTADRQFAFGVTEESRYYPTRLYWSGIIDKVDAFVGGDFGGGMTEVKADDGGEIVDLVPYENGVIVIKDNGVFRFYFTSSGFAALEEVTTGFGGISSRGSQVEDNDILFLARKDNNITVMKLGYQAQFTSGKLRSQDLGITIQPDLRDMNMGQVRKAATFLYDNSFGFTYTIEGGTENSKGFVMDMRFGSFVKWSGDPMFASHYTRYDDGNNEFLFAGSNRTGYMIRLYENRRNDTNVSYRSVIATKQFNQGKFNVTKIFRNPVLWFKYVAIGSPNVEVRVDGNDITGSVPIAASGTGTMVGEILAGEALAGGSPHEVSQTDIADDYPAELTFLVQARNIKFLIYDEGLESDWLFMGVAIPHTMLDGKPLDQQYKFYLQ